MSEPVLSLTDVHIRDRITDTDIVAGVCLDLRPGQAIGIVGESGSGKTLVFISHDLGSVAGIADRIAVLYRGELVEVGLAPAVLNRPEHLYTRLLVRSAPTLHSSAADRAERAALNV